MKQAADEYIREEAVSDYPYEYENVTKGEELMCEKHELDYRILCEECQDKYKKFNYVIKNQIYENKPL